MNDSSKMYLGDGVYGDVDQFGDVILTTENGIEATNRIVLEPAVLQAFELWLAYLRKQASQARAAMK